MQFFDAFLSAAKSSLAAITLQNANSSSSPPTPGSPTADQVIPPPTSTTSTSSFPLLSGSSTKKKAPRRAQLQPAPLPGELIDDSPPPSLSKAKGKSRILERFRDGLRSEKSRRRKYSIPAVPYIPPCPADSSTLPICASPPGISIPASTISQHEKVNTVNDITMHEAEHTPAPPSAESCTSLVSSPTPLRPSPVRRPGPKPLQRTESSTEVVESSSSSSSGSSHSSSKLSPSRTPSPSKSSSSQSSSGSWIDPSKLSPPHFQSFVRHQADVYHTLVTLSPACLFSEDGDGYMSFLRPILPVDATRAEHLHAAEKQLMARLYFWLILRGAKSWILPLDHRTRPSSPSCTAVLAPTAHTLPSDNDVRTDDPQDLLEDTVPVKTSTPGSLSPQANQEPTQALIGDGVFPSFSHLIAYLFRMQSQPRRRERGSLPRSSPSKHIRGFKRWRPPVSSPLRWTVVTDFNAEEKDKEDAKEVAESLLDTIDEEESIMEEGSESWFDMLGELDDEDMGRDFDDDDDDDDENDNDNDNDDGEAQAEEDEDDREWARLRFQMAMDVERKTWSNHGTSDHERSQSSAQDRPCSPTPDSLSARNASPRSIERHAGDVELYEHVPGPPPEHHLGELLPRRPLRPVTNLQKRSLSDSDLDVEEAARKRRRFSEGTSTTTSHGKERRSGVSQKPRIARSRSEVVGGKRIRRRVSGSSLGGSVAAL